MKSFAQQKVNFLSIGLGRATYDVQETKTIYQFTYPLAVSANQQFGLNVPQAPALTVEFHHIFNHWLSIGGDLTGLFKVFSTSNQETAFVDTVEYVANFESNYDLKAGRCRALVFFDFLKNEPTGLKIGFGPILFKSKLAYPSFITGEFDDKNEFYVLETSVTTRKATAVGASVALRGDFVFGNRWLVFLQGSYDWLKEDGLFSGMVGIGFFL